MVTKVPLNVEVEKKVRDSFSSAVRLEGKTMTQVLPEILLSYVEMINDLKRIGEKIAKRKRKSTQAVNANGAKTRRRSS